METKGTKKTQNKIKKILSAVFLCAVMSVVPAGCGRNASDTASGEAHTCTISIKCDAILDDIQNFDEAKRDFVPEDGVVLPVTTVDFESGDTVYDITRKACRDNNILMESRNTTGMIYIEGIAQMYEFDGGELSGWMYKVNGVFPEYGCGSVEVSDGDEIEWLYTMNLGVDLGNEYTEDDHEG